MVGVGVAEAQFTAPGVEIGFVFDVARGIGDDRGGFQMVREIIGNRGCAPREVLSRDAVAIEEDILGFQVAAGVGFGHDAGRHVPVERPGGGRSRELLHAVAVNIVDVAGAHAVFRRGRNTILHVEDGGHGVGRVAGDVACCVVLIVGSAAGMDAVIGIGGHAQVLGAALGGILGEQVAPRIVAVAAAPELGSVGAALVGRRRQ